MSKKDIATKLFQQYPTVEAVYFTTDGQGFLNENRANLHAQTLKEKTITVVKKEGKNEDEKQTENVLTVKQLEEFARDASDIPALEKMLEEEKAGANRKGAISALETRITTLKEQQ